MGELVSYEEFKLRQELLRSIKQGEENAKAHRSDKEQQGDQDETEAPEGPKAA